MPSAGKVTHRLHKRYKIIEFEIGGYFHSYYRSPPHQLISSTLIKDVDITCRKGFLSWVLF